ncbi:MAG: hypothetical protein J6Z38_06335, partial [Lachnospiraceae bacterium]|nr:hypothetical protein [Lachnospiraceae bacterium]
MKNTVKKTARVLLLSLVLVLTVLFSAVPASAAPTDEILNFTITVDVNDDASLEMVYHIEWKVLYDGGGSEKLEWVNLGVPNKFHENLRPLSSTISRIEDEGNYLEIYLDRGYAKNETVVFEFAMTQDHMYQIDKWVQGETVYTFTPAWFDDFSVDALEIRWNAEEAGAWQPDCLQEDGYLVFKEALSPGGRYTMSVVYPNDAFGFSVDRQADSGGDPYVPTPTPGPDGNETVLEKIISAVAAIIGLILAASFLIIPFILFVKFIKWIAGGTGFGSTQETEKKITRTKIEYYENCPSCGAVRQEGKDSCPYCGRS